VFNFFHGIHCCLQIGQFKLLDQLLLLTKFQLHDLIIEKEIHIFIYYPFAKVILVYITDACFFENNAPFSYIIQYYIIKIQVIKGRVYYTWKLEQKGHFGICVKWSYI
jgi:hypothetical protein